MSFWEQFLISQALSALHTIIRRYGKVYLTNDELAAADVLIDALAELPERISAGKPIPKMPTAPTKGGK